MKNPFPTNPSPGDIFLAGPVCISQIHGERSPRIWTLEKCRYAAHAINQHEKLVAMLRQTCVFECPVCQKTVGHADGCGLAALLREEKNEADFLLDTMEGVR